MRTRIMCSVILAAIAMSLPLPARASTEKLLRLSGMVAESPTPDLACRGLHISETGPLTGVPFGRATWSATECADALAEPGVFTIRDGTFALKARAGSVSGVYHAHASYPSANRHIYAWGPFTVTSGTGAYRGAKGSGLLAVVADPVSNTAQFELAGRLVLAR